MRQISYPSLTVPASTSRGTSERIIRSFSQSGSNSASSDVSTRKAVGSGFFSGNQMSSNSLNSPSPALGRMQGTAVSSEEPLTQKGSQTTKGYTSRGGWGPEGGN